MKVIRKCYSFIFQVGTRASRIVAGFGVAGGVRQARCLAGGGQAGATPGGPCGRVCSVALWLRSFHAEERDLPLRLNTREVTHGDVYLGQQFCKSEGFATPQVFIMRERVIQTMAFCRMEHWAAARRDPGALQASDSKVSKVSCSGSTD